MLELKRRGAEVHVRTLAAGVAAVREAGFECEPIDPAIEAVEMDDHTRRRRLAAAERSLQVWRERAPLDAADFAGALAAVEPDLALVDVSTLGAQAIAEREGIPWAASRPFLLDDVVPGFPPLGFGWRPLDGLRGRVRNRAGALIVAVADRRLRLPGVNAGRRAAGIAELGSMAEAHGRAPLTLYFTARPFEY
ncbi:MAG TPA: hypothetical protein VGK41_01535, partial [Solirubrobacterales bacterium]